MIYDACVHVFQLLISQIFSLVSFVPSNAYQSEILEVPFSRLQLLVFRFLVFLKAG